MSIWEIIFLAIGLSLDVYAVVVLYGAMLAKIEKKKLACMSIIFCAWQVLSILAGNLVTLIPVFRETSLGMQRLWDGLSVVIFFALGAYMLYKAWRREVVFERRTEISYKNVCVMAAITSLDAFFAGIGAGFLETGLLEEAIVIGISTIVLVILGIYTGYRLGYEQKKPANGIGGVILIIAGIDVIIQYVMK